MAGYFVHFNEVRRNLIQRERVFQQRNKCLDLYDDTKLIKKYRFPRDSILLIIEICKPYMERTGNRNAHELPIDTIILGCLRFMAKGNFQDDCAEIVGISQPVMSKSIAQFCRIMSSKARDFIKFPNVEEMPLVKEKFKATNGFPNIIGVIDGTHIKIKAPSGRKEPHYVCRKGGHSINVQVICDADMKFIDVVSKWPGATHDSFIWLNSYRRSTFEDRPPNGHLLGDSGYSIEPWLMTPLLNARTEAEENYNRRFKKTRHKVETTIGLFKSVFRRFDMSGGAMLYTPEKACRIIMTGCILHNLRRGLRLPQDEEFEIQDEEEPIDELNEGLAITQLGLRKREMLINNYFT